MNHARSITGLILFLMGLILACGIGSSGARGETFTPPAIAEIATINLPSPTPEATPTRPQSLPTATTMASIWQPAGFGGAGNFDGVFFDPNQPGVVYAASDVTGIFRSTDNGDHWQMRSTGLDNYEISSFAVDPFDSNTLYAGAGAFTMSNKSGIYISHDAGLTWQQLPSTFTHTITFRRFRTINAIAPDPAHPGYILSGSRENGIWRTIDGGDSWTHVYTAPLTNAPLFVNYEDDPPNPYPAPVSAVVFDPVVSSTVYAGLDGAGVVKSANSGVSWQPINTGLPTSATVKYLAVSNNHVLYAAVGTAGVYTSANGGDSWQAANGSPPLPLVADYDPGGHPAWVSSVAVHPTNSNIAYLSLVTYDHANVWKTTDGGATWVEKGNVTIDPVNDPTEAWATTPPGGGYWPYTLSWQVTLDPHNPNRLFYVSYWDIVRSDDGGEYWMNKIVGTQNTCVNALAIDTDHPAGQPDRLYAAHWDAGLLASTNKGITWTAVIPSTFNDPAMAGHYWRFAIARSGGVKYYYTVGDPSTNYGQVLRSTNGISWTVVFTNPRPTGTWMGGFMLGLAVDPGTPSTLYVTQDGGQVWKSASNGAPGSWSPTTSQPGGNSFTYALAVDAQHRVYAGTIRDGLWRFTSGDLSWQQVLTDQATIFHLLAVSNTVYASAGDANLYQSADGGDTWQKLTNYSATDDGDGIGDQGMAIAVDPRNPDHIFFSRRDPWHSADVGSGLVKSADGGAIWTPINTGLGNLNVSAMAVGPDGDLFAGTSCGGIWRRTVGASQTYTTYLPLILNGFTASSPPGLSSVNDFLFQLQNLNLTAIGDTKYDLVVMDYSSDGSASGEFTAPHIAALKHSPAGGDKIVLAYMSIGEAENYRFYWQSGWTPGNPAWLDAENPNWPGNYKVHYWDPAWQSIILSYTDRLLNAGFDGAYLDIIDAYQYYADQGRTTAAPEMANFVATIAAHARADDPDFYIFPQNATELASEVPAYLNVVNGIGQEDTYYGYTADDTVTPISITNYLETHLDVFKNAGKLVLTIDYATTRANVDDAYAKSQAKGYVPFCTVRTLNQLTINPGHEPD